MNTGPHDAALSPEDIAAPHKEAFESLFSGLREAKRRFETGDDAGRAGVIHAVETWAKFSSRYRTAVEEGLNAPLLGLNNALLALDGIASSGVQ